MNNQISVILQYLRPHFSKIIGFIGFVSSIVTILNAGSIGSVILFPITIPLFLFLPMIIMAGIPIGSFINNILLKPKEKNRYPKDSLEYRYYEKFYHFRQSFAPSIRLVGAEDEFFPPENVHIIPTNKKYRLPPKLLLERKEIVSILEQEAIEKGKLFYNGPHTRLCQFRVFLSDRTEQKHLEMTFGPVNWHDYSICQWMIDNTPNYKDLEKYIDLNTIVDSYDLKANKFSNIICTATTIVTQDGFALYSQRSEQVSSDAGSLTSCIAENIHQDKDASLKKSSEEELPVPFRTVIRGIQEEMSPQVAEFVKCNPKSLFLLGLDFSLKNFHPNLLFMVALPFEIEEILNQCREQPGRDFIEGQINSISVLNLERNKDLKNLMSNPNWIPSGKASLIRSLEFLQSVQNKNGLNFEQMIKMLASGETTVNTEKNRIRM